MMRSLFSGVAGLKTHQVKMDVIGNNIANVNTTSFKSQSITFSDLMYQTTQRASRATETTGGINARQIGLGAKSGAIATAITQQGATETTNNPFDMRITGDAFFVVNNGNQTMFTRDGSFYVDGAGNLAMQSTGYFVYGWTAAEDPETGAITVNTNGGIGKLQIMSAENMTYPPEGTTEGLVSGNIDAHDTNITSDNGKTVTLEFYDNLGYLYTAKFAVRDVDNLEHTYTMTLEDILDSKGNTIGAEKLSHVTFTDLDNDEQTYGIRDSWTKTITTTNYTATVGAKNASFKDSKGATAYSGIPVSGSISSLVDKAPQLLRNVYNLSVGVAGDNSVASTDYYTINSDGSISVYPVTSAETKASNLGTYYKNSSTDSTVTYGTYENSTYATLTRKLDLSAAEDLSENQKDVLKSMFGVDFDDDTKFPFDPGKKDYSYELSTDGVSSITVYENTYETSDPIKLADGFHMVTSVSSTTTVTINNIDSDTNLIVAKEQNEFGALPDQIRTAYGLKTGDYPTTNKYKYSISNDGNIVITSKSTTNKDIDSLSKDLIAEGKTFDHNEGDDTCTINGTTVAMTGTISSDNTDAELALLALTKGDLPATGGTTSKPETYVYKYTINHEGVVTVNRETTATWDDTTQLKKDKYNFYIDTTTNKAVYSLPSRNKTFELSGELSYLDSESIDLLECYGFTSDRIKPSEGNSTFTYKYKIDDNGDLIIYTTKKTTSTYDNEMGYSVYMNTGSNIVFRNYKSEVETAIPLSGNINTLTNSQKNVLKAIYNYTPGNDDVTYKISDDGTTISVGTKNNSGVKSWAITQTTTETQLTFEIDEDETTATYRNASEEGKVVYDKIPRTGYVSEIFDATLTADFFPDVYNYNPDKSSGDYENLTYHILDDGTLQIVNNSITMKYNAKTGAIEQPTEKIVLNFDQDALIDGQPKMAGFTDVNIDLSPTTNYNTMATSTIGAVKGDKQSLKTGRAVGEMNGVTIGKDGTIYATYSNGQTKLLGQIATAEFANASGLEKNGDNLYTQTLNSGEATIQDVTTDGGYITTGVLEMSNVDLSSEFTSMITTQRGFQANSRIITVSDTLLEELTNLKR
ncbi:flagellar hook-basal body complex protein [Butyrivibrio sp. XPD2002]|uniref:flagellar hook-basal body complex protein n=1 Tax=Butyrivibrio sp. XPD2002 TaxID=1280665 RepID=UPI0004152F2F|nr:flagellar hook-basal body complex protein [Butyrivibrio sp. XPD2002]